MILHGGRASNIKKGVGKPRLKVVGLVRAEALRDARLMYGTGGEMRRVEVRSVVEVFVVGW
jgi:hypothetical protein